MKRIFLLLLLVVLGLQTTMAQGEYTKFKITDGSAVPEVRSNIQTNLEEMFKAFLVAVEKGTKPVLPKKGFSKAAIEGVKMLWEGSAFICPTLNVEESLVKVQNQGWEVRDIPVTMLSYDEDSEKDLVISFDDKGNVTGVDLAMESRVYKRLLATKGNVVDFGRRQKIINFLETFRTAYNKGSLEYLRQVYSDDALIITGRVVKPKQQKPGDQQQLLGERIEYVRQTKKEYMDKLAAVFKNNKYINVGFSDIDIINSEKNKNIYGITLRQKWQTSNYSDDGFLFLMIDFSDEKNPTIHVRTWQPAFKNGMELPKDEVFGLHSFNISD